MKIATVEQHKFSKKGYVFIEFDEKAVDGSFVISDKESLRIKIPANDKLNYRHAVIIARKIIQFAKKNAVKKIVIDWELIKKMQLGEEKEIAEVLAVNFIMANYEFIKYKTTAKSETNFVEEVVILLGKEKSKVAAALEKGKIIGEQVNASRELANISGADMTPEILVSETKKAIKGTGIKMQVLGEPQMEKLKMQAVLSVGKGSKEESKFIILEYGNPKEKNPIVLIGKGITFDSGGLNIKTGEGMSEMNMDMSGGAAVIQALVAYAKLGLKRRVICLVPAVESMPSGESLRPGDIITSMSGKTIEVQNTDAEGRIVLADANTYAEKFKPQLVVNVATLTGAASVALGERASALLTKDKKLADYLCQLGEESGDYLWPLPMWDEYEEEIKGNIGDVCNIRNRQSTRDGGTILGGMFIYQFGKKFPQWAHIDMAPKMTAVYDEFLAPGSAGAPVRLLVKLLEKFNLEK